MQVHEIFFRKHASNGTVNALKNVLGELYERENSVVQPKIFVVLFY